MRQNFQALDTIICHIKIKLQQHNFGFNTANNKAVNGYDPKTFPSTSYPTIYFLMIRLTN
jgi:hypothetical protein